MNTIQQSHNSIIAEIHSIREQLAEQYHDDLHAYSQAAEAHCRALGFEIVASPYRPIVNINAKNIKIDAEAENS